MLVHRETLGVVSYIWTGKERTDMSGRKIQIYDKLDLDSIEIYVEDFDPAEWWEISDNSTLAKRIKIFYPFFEPICDGVGNLIDIKPTITPEDQAVIDDNKRIADMIIAEHEVTVAAAKAKAEKATKKIKKMGISSMLQKLSNNNAKAMSKARK